jgi:acyl carrier protein
VPGRGVAKAPAAPGAVLNERLARVPAIARHEVRVEFVRGEVAAVLGAASLDSVDLDAGLFEMGMDSLMSVELRRRLEVGAGRKLPSTLTFNYPNVGALAGFLLRELDVAETSVVAAVAFAPPPGSPIAANESLDELSDDELEARLLARLTEAR